MANSTIGWIGAGKMGGPMTKRLIDAGHRVLVLDPDPHNRVLASQAGAEIAADLRAVAAEASIIFSMIPNDAVLTQIVLDENGLAVAMPAGSIFVAMSTVSPAASTRVAETLGSRGVAYIRAPVSGSTALAQAGTL